jgi:hypothetical protein
MRPNLRWSKKNTRTILVSALVGVAFLPINLIFPSFHNLLYPFDSRSAYYLHESVNQDVPPGQLTVPIEIFILNSESKVVTYTDANLEEILAWTNQVWTENADISFELLGIHRLEVPDDRVEISQTNPEAIALARDFLGDKFGDEVIDVMIVKSMSGAPEGGGIAVGSSKIVVTTAFENMAWAKWNFAHELGHNLNLRDVVQKDNLMQWNRFYGNIDYKKEHFPTDLTREQVLTVRDWAYRNFGES